MSIFDSPYRHPHRAHRAARGPLEGSRQGWWWRAAYLHPDRPRTLGAVHV